MPVNKMDRLLTGGARCRPAVHNCVLSLNASRMPE
jgi:hypothetical protein